MKHIKKTIFIAGGGTGGHLFPAFSIGKELQKKDLEIIYIGSKYGIEKKIFNEMKVKYILLNIKGIKRGKTIKSLIHNISFPFKFLITYFHSLILIIKYKPKAIIGTGGYCSGMPLIAGISLNITTFIQDQNSIPGLVTKKLNKKVNKIFLGYEQAKKQLKNSNCIVSGNPLRDELSKLNKIESKIKLNFHKNKKLLFIIGGSQGSSPINMHFIKKLDFYIKNNYQILWQCGEYDYNYLIRKIENKNIKIKKFIANMSIAYSAADLIISRAGALTINEITFFGKPSILIPFPHAAENHQEINAKILENNNACITIKQDTLDSGKLESCIKNLFDVEKKLINLELKSKNSYIPYATKIISDEIMNYISC